MRLLFAGIAAAFTSAFLTGATAEELAEDPRWGEEVSRICFGRNISGWKTLDREDDVVLLREGANDWYRVDLIGACDYNTLRGAIRIALDSAPFGGCITRGDFIIVEDNPGFTRRCAISNIYEWDDKAPKPEEDTETEE